MKQTKLLWWIILVIAHSGCHEQVQNAGEYTAWLLDKDNGFIKQKCFNNICIATKYLPPDYQALKAHNKNKLSSYDSLLQNYSKSISFLMEFSPDKEHGDIMYKDVLTPEDYQQKVLNLNFGMEKRVSLLVDDKTYKPALATFENTYGANETKIVSLLFVPTDSTDKALFLSDTLDIELYDDIFFTGITHYVFTRNKLNNTPTIFIP